MTYTQVFGGEPMLPADVSYRAITTSANQTLVWPTEGQSTLNYVAKLNDVTTTLGGVVFTLPDATLVSTGTTCIFNNVGSTSFQINDASGGVLITVPPSTCWVLYLAANTTAAGTWRNFQYGASTSSAVASALAGAGLKAISTTLNQNMPVFSFGTTYSASTSDRANVLMWIGSGTGTLNLDAPGTVGSDWFINVRNSGGGALTIDPAGAVNIDGSATLTLNPGNSCTIFTDGSAYYTIGLGIAATSSATFQTVAVAGTGDYTLSAAEQNKVLYKFTGALTGNRNIIVPATIQQYWVDNATTGAFTFKVGTAAQIGGGGGVAVATGVRAVLYCDGTNVVDADTGGVSTPIAIADGGTGSTTASGARTNLGATSVGNSLFTAADAAAARTAISAPLTGDITASGLTMTDVKLLGRNAGSTGAVQEITLGTNLSFSGTTLNATGGGGGGGTVTSVQVSGGTTGLTFSGGPITGSGTMTMSGTLAVANGGTGVTSSTGSGILVLNNFANLTQPVISIKDSEFTLQDNTDTTKQARFELSGITTGTTRTYTLPNNSGQLLIGGTTVTGSGGLTGGGDISTNQVISVATNGITNAMLAQISTATFKGRTTAGTGNVEDLTATQATALLDAFTSSAKGLVPSSGGGTTTFLRADGSFAAAGITALTGDVTASGTGSQAATIANNAVTYAKMQDVTATQRVIGRNTAGSGDPEEVTASQLHDWISSTRGSVLYRGASGWAALAPNTAGYVFRDGGSGADPSWVGGITRLNSGTVSSAATLDIALTSGYSKYILILDDVVPATGGSAFNLRVSVDSGSTYRSTAGDYRYSALYSTGPSGAAPALYNQAGLGDTAIILGAASANMVNTTNQPQSYVLQIYPGTASKRNTIIFKSIQTYDASGPGTPTIVSNDGGASYVGTAAALTNVRFLFGSGNISTCTWSIYGVT